MFNGMQSMAITPVDMDEEAEEHQEKEQEPLYPYNLTLTLTEDILKKLGMDCGDDDCRVGNYLHLHALAEVIGVSKTGVNIQITHMKCEDEDQENDEADKEMTGTRGSPY